MGVDITDLTGQPYRGRTASEDAAHAAIPDIRCALLQHELVPDVPARALAELEREVVRAHELRHAAALTRLGRMLPGLLMDLQVAAHQYTGRDQQTAFRLLAEAYADTGQVVYKLGYLDLDALIVERLGWAAGQSDDPLLVALYQWLQAGQLMMAASYDVGLRVVGSALGELDSGLGSASEQHLSMYGMLHQGRADRGAGQRPQHGLVPHRRGGRDGSFAQSQLPFTARASERVLGRTLPTDAVRSRSSA